MKIGKMEIGGENKQDEEGEEMNKAKTMKMEKRRKGNEDGGDEEKNKTMVMKIKIGGNAEDDVEYRGQKES